METSYSLESKFGILFKHLFFWLLIILAGVFFKERTLNFDPAFFSWTMIHDGTFFPVLGRYGALLGQLLPLLFIKFGADIKTVLIVFSISFALWYYIFFLIIQYCLKDRVAAWVLVLSLCLTFRQTFYYTTAEVYHGLALSIVLWSLLRTNFKRKNEWIRIVLLAVGTLVLPFFHQLNLILWFFLISISYLERKDWRDFKSIGLMALTIIWFFARIKFFSKSDYEKGKILSTEDHLYALKNFFELPSYKYLVEWFPGNILVPAIFFGLILMYFLLKGRLLVLAYLAVSTLGFVALIIETNFKGESPLMYENYYSLFGLFIAVGWALANGPRIKPFMQVVLILLSLFSLNRIYKSVWQYQDRTTYLKRLTEYGSEIGKDKFIIDTKNFPFAYATVPWALPMETALYSAIDSKKGNSSFFLSENADEFLKNRDDQTEFYSVPWAPTWFWVNSINKVGFNFSHNPYTVINTAREQPLSDKEFNHLVNNISLIARLDYLKMNNYMEVIHIEIKNASSLKIHSLPEGPSQTKLGYKIHQNGVVRASQMMPLEVDIVKDSKFRAGMIVYNPIDLTKATITFGLHTSGYGWWAETHHIPFEAN